MKVKAWAAACLCAAAVVMTTASAQVDDRGARGPVLEALRQQREQAAADRHGLAPSLAAPAAAVRQAPVAGESPCSWAHALAVEGWPAAERPLWQEFEAFAGACLGPVSLAALQHNLALRLSEQGWITSRVVLSAGPVEGVLHARVEPGRIESIEATGSEGRRWRHVLDLAEGDVLDLYQLDAALDQLNRLGGEAALLQLEPGTAPGTTRVRLLRGARAAPQWAAAADNGGPREFGRAQLDLELVLDEPLGWLDQLRLGLGSNAGAGMQRSASLHYGLPWRRHLISLGATASCRRQTVRGTTLAFDTAGRDRSLSLRWELSAWRSGQAKAGPWLAWRERRARSELADTELVVQRRHRALREVGLQGWAQGQAWRLAVEASHEEGRRAGAANPFLPQDGRRSRADRLALRLHGEPPEGGPAWRLEGRLQRGRHPAIGTDLFVLGSAASVRGHAVDDALAAESGALLRGELAWPATAAEGAALQPYLAADVGWLRGPMAQALPRRRLAGAALGLRLAGRDLSADLALAAPLDGTRAAGAARWHPLISLRAQL